MVFHSLLQRSVLCQYSPPWSIHLGWPCMTCLIASLSYTRLWPVWSFWLAFCDCGFYSGGCRIAVLASSVCPEMDEDKRLVQDSWWEGLAVGKTESCSGCWAGCTRLEKVTFYCNLKKGNAKECSNHHTIALISHTNKIRFKILQARLQKYLNRKLLNVQTGFRKGRRTRDLIANIHWII